MAERQRTVLMVDHEAILLLVLAYELDQAGIRLIPATSVKQARSMLARLKIPVDALIIDCRVPAVCSLAEAVVQHNAKLQVVGLVSGTHQCARCRHLFSARFSDPEFRDAEWVSGITSLIKMRLAKKPKIVPIRKSPYLP